MEVSNTFDGRAATRSPSWTGASGHLSAATVPSGSLRTVSAAAGVAAFARVSLGALLTLTVSLACALMWIAVIDAPDAAMPSMPPMGGEPVAALAAAPAPREVTTAMMTDTSEHIGMPTCTSPCAQIVSVCGLGVALAVVSILGLLLVGRRDTFVGLLARRQAVHFIRRPPWLRTPWTVLSLSSLCVLRV